MASPNRAVTQPMGRFLRVSTAGVFTLMHSFYGPDGAFPYSPPVIGVDGRLYGYALGFGAHNAGTVYRVSESGTFNGLYAFTSSEGTGIAPLAQYTDGSFFGATYSHPATPPITGASAGESIYRLLLPDAVPASNPVPSVGQISPNTAVAGSTSTVITLTGSDFVANSVVVWNGVALPTTFGSATSLRAVVPSAYLTAAGSAAVTVLNSTPGGGQSATASFVIAPHLEAVVHHPPTSLRAVGEDGRAFLTWTASSGATSYKIRVTLSGSSRQIIGITTTQSIVTGLIAGTTNTIDMAAQ